MLDANLPRRKEMPPSIEPATAASTVTPLVTLDQARSAAALHERAVQLLASGGDTDYARQLLANCLKLDPSNTIYRKTLRDIHRQAASSTLGRWFGSLSVFAFKSKMRLARSNGDWRKVLEQGEVLLAHHPLDSDAPLEMAEAADQLDVAPLAVWLLQQGLEQALATSR